VLLFKVQWQFEGRAHARENWVLAEFYHAPELFRKWLGTVSLGGDAVGDGT